MEDKLFEHIIVTEELLETRTAASRGDLQAMFVLLQQVIKGEHTARSGRHACSLLNEMLDHQHLHTNPKRFWNSLVLQVHAYKLLNQEGEISYEEYIRQGCTFLQIMIRSMTESPRHYWNYNQLINAIDWIRENEPKLQEEEVV